MNRPKTSRWSFAVSAHSQSLTLGMRRSATAVLIREPAGEIVSVPNADVEKLDASPVSLMPPASPTDFAPTNSAISCAS